MPFSLKYKIIYFSFLSFLISDFIVAEEVTPSKKVNNDAKVEQKTELVNLAINTSNWKCKYCPEVDDEPWHVESTTGLGLLSNDSYKFGEYNGLYKKGGFLIFDIEAMYRDDSANYFTIYANDLGLSTRSVEMEGGKQGQYKVNFEVNNINRYQLDTARTPYSGTENQTLPSGWVNGATTSAMTSLPSDLQNINYYTLRRHISVSSNIIQNARWNYDISFKRQTKEGKTPFAATIGTTFADAKSAVLAKPIDYTSDRFELTANYNNNSLNGSISFINSVFKNNYQALRWDNAFTTGANSGQISLEPDNQMQQLMLNSQYRGYNDIILTGTFSVARLTQNQSFLPYTTNTALTPVALPVNSLNARVDVINANANVNWFINKKSKIKLSFEHQEQDNLTKRATYSYVTADNAILGSNRANFPYGFRTQKLKLQSTNSLENDHKIVAGLEYALYDRSYQEVNRSAETSIWAKYANKLSSDVHYSLKVKGDTRKANSYNVLTEISPAENSQLRKYNLADKNTLKAVININFEALEALLINLNLESASNRYSNSNVGLAKSNDLAIGLDAQYSISEEITVSAYLQQSLISSTQNGSTSSGDADWSAENKDAISTIGIASNYNIIEDQLNIGFDFTHSSAIGKIMLIGSSADQFPDFVTKRNSMMIYGDYIYDENMTLKLSYRYEEYQEQNWSIDGVTQSSIDNVLTLGNVSPNYKIGVVWASVKYLF